MKLEKPPTFEVEITKLGAPYARANLGTIDPGAAYDVGADFRKRFPMGDGFRVDLFRVCEDDGRARVLAVVDVLDFRKRFAA